MLFGDHGFQPGFGKQAHPIELTVDHTTVNTRHAAGIAMPTAAGHFHFPPYPAVHGFRPGFVGILLEGQCPQRGLIGAILGGEQFRLHIGHDLGHMTLLSLTHAANVVLRLQGFGDFLAQKRAYRHTGNTTHDFTQQEALVMDVIGGLCADLP